MNYISCTRCGHVFDDETARCPECNLRGPKGRRELAAQIVCVLISLAALVIMLRLLHPDALPF